MGRRWSNAKSFISLHKPEILGVTGTVLGVAAFGTAIYATHKRGSDDYKGIKAERSELIRKKNCGEISQDEFRSENMKVVGKGALTLAKDYAIPVGLEIGSHVCYHLAGSSYRGQIKSLVTDVAGLTATVAMMKANIKDEYGEEGLKKVMTVPTKKTIEVKDENGKKKKVDIELEDPALMCIDQRAYEDALKYGWPYSPTRIKIDERFSIFNTTNGEISQMLFPLKTAYDMSNEQMWDDGFITVWDILKNIGMEAKATKTLSRSEALRYGVIDQPEAFDRILKKYVKTPGFDESGVADRKDGLYMFHKRLSFGAAQDAMLDDFDEYEVLLKKNDSKIVEDQIAYDETTNREYLYIDIFTDGDISRYKIDEPTSERKKSAWEQAAKIDPTYKDLDAGASYTKPY